MESDAVSTESPDPLSVRPPEPELVESLPRYDNRPQELSWRLWNEVFVPDCKYDHDYELWVWEGRSTHLANEYGVSVPYFQQTLTHLRRMGCIETLKKGGGTTGLTVYHLIRPPSLTLWNEGTRDRVTHTRRDVVDQRHRDILRRLDRIEQWIRNNGGTL